MPSPNNPPTPEFFSSAQNPSLHDSILSNTSGHLISVNVANHFTPGNFHSLAQLSSENHDLQPAFGQMMEEYPAMQGPPAPGKSKNPFALNRNDLEVETTGTSYPIYFAQTDDYHIDPPFTNSSNESSSVPSPFWRDDPPQHQVSVSFCTYVIPSYANIMNQKSPKDMGSGSWSSTNSNLVSLVSLPSTSAALG